MRLPCKTSVLLAPLNGCFAGSALEEVVLGVPVSAWRVVCLAAVLLAVSPRTVVAFMQAIPSAWHASLSWELSFGTLCLPAVSPHTVIALHASQCLCLACKFVVETELWHSVSAGSGGGAARVG